MLRTRVATGARELKLAGLEDTIDPERVEGYIRANGYEVPLDFSRSLQIDN